MDRMKLSTSLSFTSSFQSNSLGALEEGRMWPRELLETIVKFLENPTDVFSFILVCNRFALLLHPLMNSAAFQLTFCYEERQQYTFLVPLQSTNCSSASTNLIGLHHQYKLKHNQKLHQVEETFLCEPRELFSLTQCLQTFNQWKVNKVKKAEVEWRCGLKDGKEQHWNHIVVLPQQQPGPQNGSGTASADAGKEPLTLKPLPQTLVIQQTGLQSVTHWKRGLQHGKQVSYFQNGNVNSITLWQNGKRHGKENSWDPTGKLYYTCNWVNDLKEGDEVVVHSNNQKSQCTYKDGLKNGSETVTYPDGKPFQQRFWKNDVKDGEEITFFETGRLSYRCGWVAGVRDGDEERFSKNGIKVYVCAWEKGGKRKGSEKHFGEDGKEVVLIAPIPVSVEKPSSSSASSLVSSPPSSTPSSPSPPHPGPSAPALSSLSSAAVNGSVDNSQSPNKRKLMNENNEVKVSAREVNLLKRLKRSRSANFFPQKKD